MEHPSVHNQQQTSQIVKPETKQQTNHLEQKLKEKYGQQKQQQVNRQVTQQQAFAWIKKNNKQINPNEWRVRFYDRLGIIKEQPELQKQNQFQNESYYINFFSQRTSQNIRNRYLSRLMIGEEQPRKKNQHIFIFDWDDTILCTSYLQSFQFIDIGPEIRSLLEKLDDSSLKLLQKSKEKAQKLYIITNAAKGWVQYSSRLYLPKTHSIIISAHIKIISARSTYGQQFPGDFARWKIQAFKSILSNADRGLLTNLICIGDNNIEMEAAHVLSKQIDHSVVKTIKFRENPKPHQLIKQQQLVSERMREIFQSTRNLTIRLERRAAG